MRTTITRRRLLSSALLLVAALLAAPGRAAERIHLVVLHTNDVHGQVQARRATWIDREHPPDVGGLARVAAYVREVRGELEGTGAGLVVVDAGDWFQGTPEGLIDRGEAFLGAMTRVGYDAMCVGNHELDHGLDVLTGMLERARPPAVLANVRDPESGARVAWARPWRVVERAGLRVALVGLLSTDTPSITHRDASALRFVEPAEELATVRAELGDSVDLVLPLTHCGVRADVALAKAHPDLPLIVGGHSHTYLAEGVREGDTLIVQTGSKASAVGRVDLWFDAETHALLERRCRLVDLLAEPAPEDRDAELDRRCAAMTAQSEAEMAKVVGVLAVPLTRSHDRLRSSTAGNLITDVLRERMGADVALHNRGGIRCDLEAGEVTRRHLFELLPFGNSLIVMTLSGAELEECLRVAVEGRGHSGLEFSGVVVDVVEDSDGAQLVGVRVGGAPLERERDYLVATNSFLADGGDEYEPLERGRDRREDPAFLREMMADWFARHERVAPSAENRYHVREDG